MTALSKKYLVIAKKWSDEADAQVNYIAGEFDSYMNASLFCGAYAKYYSAKPWIVEIDANAYIK